MCWNNKSYLEPCLRSLFESGMRHAFEVVVVDNGSTDGSQEMLRSRFPQVQIVENDRNLGLGRASNQGIEATRAPYVLLLNNDTLVERRVARPAHRLDGRHARRRRGGRHAAEW